MFLTFVWGRRTQESFYLTSVGVHLLSNMSREEMQSLLLEWILKIYTTYKQTSFLNQSNWKKKYNVTNEWLSDLQLWDERLHSRLSPKEAHHEAPLTRKGPIEILK